MYFAIIDQRLVEPSPGRFQSLTRTAVREILTRKASDKHFRLGDVCGRIGGKITLGKLRPYVQLVCYFTVSINVVRGGNIKARTSDSLVAKLKPTEETQVESAAACEQRCDAKWFNFKCHRLFHSATILPFFIRRST